MSLQQLRQGLIFFSFIFSFSLVSCDKKGEKKLTIIPEKETIAVVNNKKLSLAEFQKQLQLFQKKYRKFTTGDSHLKMIKAVVIKRLIDHELIKQEAARKGIGVSNEELESKAASLLNPYVGSDTESLLLQNEISRKDWKKWFKDFLLQKKIVEKEVLQKIPVTKREIDGYRKKHKQDIIFKKAYHVRNITLSTKDEAKAVLLQLERGKTFIDLVRKYSTSPDRTRDGDLGYIQRGDLPPELESAIFKSGFRSGESHISGIIQSQDGFHILIILGHRGQVRLRHLNQNEAKKIIKKIFIRQKSEQFYANWVKQLRAKATISIDQAMLASEEGF
jgi:parvulin-like peptidyl-prolyl isomerase